VKAVVAFQRAHMRCTARLGAVAGSCKSPSRETPQPVHRRHCTHDIGNWTRPVAAIDCSDTSTTRTRQMCAQDHAEWWYVAPLSAVEAIRL